MIDATREDVAVLALQPVFATTCWFSLKSLVPSHGRERHAEAERAVHYTLTILSAYIVGEARDYLSDLRAKYLR